MRDIARSGCGAERAPRRVSWRLHISHITIACHPCTLCLGSLAHTHVVPHPCVCSCQVSEHRSRSGNACMDWLTDKVLKSDRHAG